MCPFLPSECHGGVPRRHFPVLHGHLKDPKGAADNDGSGEENVAHKTSSEDLFFQVAGWLFQNVMVYRFES